MRLLDLRKRKALGGLAFREKAGDGVNTPMKPPSSIREMKPKRVARRRRQRALDQTKEEANRQRALGGGHPNELGVVQGQNGEQGNTVDPRKAIPLGRSAH
jgi:hypothetical protein